MELIGRRPDRNIILYFLAAIVIGTILLELPISAANGPISVLDSLFTATSAVCVTGLTVVDTGHDFTLFGQVVILMLIQLGGLGILTFASALILAVVPDLTFKDKLAVSHALGTTKRVSTKSLLRAVIVTALVCELAGTAALFLRFKSHFPVGEAFFHALFHAVSAFCNAGFSTFTNSLEAYSGDIPTLAIFAVLIILGGLGFVVIRELAARLQPGAGRLSLHSKLCLAATAMLLAVGTLAFLVAEYNNSFARMGFVQSLANALFQAVTCRTAGFNTVAQSALTEVSLLITIILMFIGACPGSTGGGIKTTTMAIVLLLAYDRFMGRRSVAVFKRSISPDSISRALTVLLVAILVIVALFVVLMFAEERPLPHTLTHGWFVDSLFEVISAFGTVGLSLGATAHLHALGKIVLIVLMFAGRVGLLTLVYALARPIRQGEIVYREESVMVG
ncbi:MAG TPA: TrkH family potassium uptake protein [Acidobacteriota bacterium]|nr:TrkH family potassium uptake protein [Acidobacteriota bacterium]